MLHVSENWAQPLSGMHHLRRNDLAMIRWVCGVTTKEQVSSQDPLERVQLDDLARALCTYWIRWYGDVGRNDGWLQNIQKLNPTGGHRRGRPNETWREMI